VGLAAESRKGTVSNPPDTIILEPTHGWRALQLAELWRYREVIYFLAWRDIKVRYKQTVLGAAWAVLQPLLAVLVFAIFLGRLAGVPSEGVPYPIFCLAGLLPWTYFANSLTRSSGSLVENANLISKVYFPRLAVPISGVISGLIDLFIGLVVLGILLLIFGVTPRLTLLLLPVFIALTSSTALAVGIWLAALHVQYRDVRHVTPFLVQIWMFATPVVYPASLIPERYQALYGLNPMAGVVEGFRWAILGQSAAPTALLVVSVGTVFALLASGLFFFRRMERVFGDVV
jgi:lipopolysaccharide transport system permease protein